MKSYNEIFKRILEIIKLSDDIKNNFSSNNKDFITLNHFTIYKSYVDEFIELLDAERTIFLLNQNKNNNVGKKNYELMKICKNGAKNDIIYRDEFIRLYEILVSSFSHSALELIEHSGYYVLKSHYEEFCELCQKLKIGPNFSSKDVSVEEAKYIVKTNLGNHKAQYSRIKKHYEELVLKRNAEPELAKETEHEKEKIEIAESLLEEVTKDSELITEDVVELETVDKSEGKLQTLNCDFKEIIFLGMSGLLNVEMIVQLKAVLEKDEFKKLLDLLLEYKIFDDRTIFEIKRRLVTKFRVVSDINELVAYFAIRRGINIESLKSLIPSIGETNYHYLIDQLFRYGTIGIDEYKNYLIENNLLVEDISRK